jgi:hypothetical protein
VPHIPGMSHKIKFLQKSNADMQMQINSNYSPDFVDNEIKRLNLRENNDMYRITTILSEKLYNTIKKDIKVSDSKNPNIDQNSLGNIQQLCALNGVRNETYREDVTIKNIDLSVISLENDDDLKKACHAVKTLSSKIEKYRLLKKYDNTAESESLHDQVNSVIYKMGRCSVKHGNEKKERSKRKAAESCHRDDVATPHSQLSRKDVRSSHHDVNVGERHSHRSRKPDNGSDERKRKRADSHDKLDVRRSGRSDYSPRRPQNAQLSRQTRYQVTHLDDKQRDNNESNRTYNNHAIIGNKCNPLEHSDVSNHGHQYGTNSSPCHQKRSPDLIKYLRENKYKWTIN